MKTQTGLRLEIVLNIILLVGAALLLGSFLLLKMTEKELLAERVSRARSLVRLVSGIASVPDSPAGVISRLGSAEILLRRLVVDPTLLSWRVVDSQLREVAGFSAAGGEADFGGDLQLARLEGEPQVRVRYPAHLFSFTTPGPDDVTVTGGLFSAGRFLGAVQARFSLVDIRRRLVAAQELVLLYVLCYGTVLVLFGVYLLDRNVVRPVRRLMDTTRQVAAGHLDQRLETEGPREIAALGDSFNRMVANLQTSRQNLEERNRLLEVSNTELRQTRNDLVRSEKMASVGHLAAGMAHEIGNPLGAVVGYLELLKGELAPGRSREIIVHALAEAGRIDRLVRDLLDYASPAAAVLVPVDLAAVTRDALERLGCQQALAGVNIDQGDLPGKLAPVLGARHKLLQVLINLLLNAYDVSPAGGTIRLSGANRRPGLAGGERPGLRHA